MKPSHSKPPLPITEEPPKDLQVSCDHKQPVRSPSGTTGCSHQPRRHSLWLPAAVNTPTPPPGRAQSGRSAFFQEQRHPGPDSAPNTPAACAVTPSTGTLVGSSSVEEVAHPGLTSSRLLGARGPVVMVARSREEACPRSQVKRELPPLVPHLPHEHGGLKRPSDPLEVRADYISGGRVPAIPV